MTDKLTQGTDAWKSERKNYIGASEASVLTGDNPYKTPYQLWQEKLGIIDNDFDNKAMKLGRDKEDEARQYLSDLLGIPFIGNPDTVSHPEHEFIRASLDGISPCGKYMCEIKTPYSENSEAYSYAVLGVCPNLYYPQLQQQHMLYPNVEKAYFFVYNPRNPMKSPAPIVVERNDDFITNLKQKLIEFWFLVSSGTPPELSDRDYQQAEGELQEMMNRMLKLKKYVDEYEDIKKQIKTEYAGQNYIGDGIKITTYPIKGKVDYGSIPELAGVDFDLYRKPPSSGTRISFIK